MPVDLYWHACVEPEDHVAAATAAVFRALGRPGRRWNPFAERMVLAEIRGRLRAAARGELRPVDQVKPIGERDALFEIRWLDIPVTEVAPDGSSRHSTTGARLLHAEPLALSVCAVGLHAHEKPHGQDDATARARQDAEIRVALDRYHAGVGTLWGLRRSSGLPQPRRGE